MTLIDAAASQALAEYGIEDANSAVEDYESVLQETPNDFEAERDMAEACRSSHDVTPPGPGTPTCGSDAS